MVDEEKGDRASQIDSDYHPMYLSIRQQHTMGNRPNTFSTMLTFKIFIINHSSLCCVQQNNLFFQSLYFITFCFFYRLLHSIGLSAFTALLDIPAINWAEPNETFTFHVLLLVLHQFIIVAFYHYPLRWHTFYYDWYFITSFISSSQCYVFHNSSVFDSFYKKTIIIKWKKSSYKIVVINEKINIKKAMFVVKP